MSTKPEVSFIGLGAMGFGMAANLVREGYPVTGFDVYGPTLERFENAGGKAANTPSAAVFGKEFCVCMVATAQQAQLVFFDGENPAVPALPQGAVVLLCSTVPFSYVQGLEKELQAKGRGDIVLIDCPVSGGATRAADGTLSIMAGASDAGIDKARDLLQVMSDPEKLYIVQGGIGAGSNMKMCHQVLAANQILSASEAMGLASHLGLDLHKTAAAIIKSNGWSWMFEHRSPRMLDPNFQPLASALGIIMKDTSIITSEARRATFPTPMTSTAEQVYFTGMGRGYAADDDSSLIRLYTEGKGKMGPLSGLASTEEDKTTLVTNLLRGIHICSAAETVSFAHKVGLDLNQVFDLCINAAGGSRMLSDLGPEMMAAVGAGRGLGDSKTRQLSLKSITAELQAAVDEAQRLKAPLFLGNQALNLMRMGLDLGIEQAGSMVEVWTAKQN